MTTAESIKAYCSELQIFPLWHEPLFQPCAEQNHRGWSDRVSPIRHCRSRGAESDLEVRHAEASGVCLKEFVPPVQSVRRKDCGQTRHGSTAATASEGILLTGACRAALWAMRRGCGRTACRPDGRRFLLAAGPVTRRSAAGDCDEKHQGERRNSACFAVHRIHTEWCLTQ